MEFADLHITEILNKISKSHIEFTIIFILDLKLFFSTQMSTNAIYHSNHLPIQFYPMDFSIVPISLCLFEYRLQRQKSMNMHAMQQSHFSRFVRSIPTEIIKTTRHYEFHLVSVKKILPK